MEQRKDHLSPSLWSPHDHRLRSVRETPCDLSTHAVGHVQQLEQQCRLCGWVLPWNGKEVLGKRVVDHAYHAVSETPSTHSFSEKLLTFSPLNL